MEHKFNDSILFNLPAMLIFVYLLIAFGVTSIEGELKFPMGR